MTKNLYEPRLINIRNGMTEDEEVKPAPAAMFEAVRNTRRRHDAVAFPFEQHLPRAKQRLVVGYRKNARHDGGLEGSLDRV